MQEEKVELCPAFIWICPNCCDEQFEKAIFVEFSKEEREEMMKDYGMVAREGDWLAGPKEVVCLECNVGFDTIDFNEEVDYE